jgi:hypothetical protein
MAKVTGPLLSLDASGTIASTMTFSRWKGVNYVRQRVIPTYKRTTEQAAVRDIVKDASLAWKTNATVDGVVIDAAYKLAYNVAASGMAMSGFNLFIKECIAGNLVDTGGVKSYTGTLAIAATPGAVIA